MQIALLSGTYAKGSDLRTSLPRNMVPVPKSSGISEGYFRPAPGIVQQGSEGPGISRGAENWRGVAYRVMGTKLVRVDANGSLTVLGDVGGSGPVSFSYSFDRLAIASGGRLFYWDGTTLSQVTDADLGTVNDQLWIDGYFMVTDGTTIAVTELNDPMQVNPLKYGSAESDPDPIVALKRVRSEVLAVGRYTIEYFQNVGGDNFPFQRIDGAQVQRGAMGKKCAVLFLESLAFLGSGKKEAPAIYLAGGGAAQKISTREIDQILKGYTEEQLSSAELEVKVDEGHQHLMIHLPDQTIVFDGAATAAIGSPVWFTLTSSIDGLGQYRARHLLWCYDKWTVGDTQAPRLGVLSEDVSSHWGGVNGWDLQTVALYNAGKGAVVHELELVGLPGMAQFGEEPTIWTSYSLDGKNWSMEKPIDAGKTGETGKRLCWRRQGSMRLWRIQRFRGTSDAHVALIRLEMAIEPLS